MFNQFCLPFVTMSVLFTEFSREAYEVAKKFNLVPTCSGRVVGSSMAEPLAYAVDVLTTRNVCYGVSFRVYGKQRARQTALSACVSYLRSLISMSLSQGLRVSEW